jgi:hypothetical protein
MKPPQQEEQQEPPAEAQQEQQQGPGGEQQEGQGLPGSPGSGIRPSGLPQGVAPGQIQNGPGGMPSIMSLISGMKNGKANMEAGVMRKVPTG